MGSALKGDLDYRLNGLETKDTLQNANDGVVTYTDKTAISYYITDYIG